MLPVADLICQKKLTYKMAKTKRKQPKRKINLVFDENKRRDFLTGFHKRKLQRKKRAQEVLQQQLKEERKRLKTEARESFKKLLVSSRPIPEVEELLKDEYEEDNVTVKVIELSDVANGIGTNQVEYQKEEEGTEQSGESESEVPGMELKPKIRRKNEEQKKVFRNDKDIKKELKKQATRNVKKSKVFQKKNQIERRKQKKKSLQQKKLSAKFTEKHKKSKRNQQNSR